MWKIGHILFLMVCLVGHALGQKTLVSDTSLNQIAQKKIGDEIVYMIIEGKDTFFIKNLEGLTVSAERCFDTPADERKYKIYRRYAKKVYPYALEAIEIIERVNEVLPTLTKRQKRKYLNRAQSALSEKFEGRLKKLTRTQGLILMKMVEKQVEMPMYDIIKNYRGGFKAMYWDIFSGFYGFNLKEGYIRGDDEIMDIILNDFNLKPND